MAYFPKPVALAIPTAVSQFNSFSDSALISWKAAGAIYDRSRASLYRDAKAGRQNLSRSAIQLAFVSGIFVI